MSIQLTPSSASVGSTSLSISLVGSGTSWVQGTTDFALGGVSGCSIVSSLVTDSTHATLVVNTGTQPGIMVVLDGSSSFGSFTVTPSGMDSVFSDDFLRSNSSVGGVGNGWVDPIPAWEILSNQAASLVSGDFTTRLIRPIDEAFQNGTVRIHFGPGYSSNSSAIILFGRLSDVTSLGSGVGVFLFPGGAINGLTIFSMVQGSSAPNVLASSTQSGTFPAEGWLELVFNAATVTANVYGSDGVTLVATLSYSTLTGPLLSAGTTGFAGFLANNYVSEFDSFVPGSPGITLSPTTIVGSAPVSVTVLGVGTNFSGQPFSISGTPTAEIISQTINSPTNATLEVSAGSFLGNLVITDSGSGFTATLEALKSAKGTLKIGYIGDSITFGINGDPVGDMGGNLENLGFIVTQVNNGFPGSTSQNWAQSSGGPVLPETILAFQTAGVQYVQLMLGTNDAPHAIAVSDHFTYMSQVVSACLVAGFKVIINQPLWAVPGSDINGAIFPTNCNTLYQQYHNADLALVDNINVFAGDTNAMNWFQNNPSDLNDGVHPTAAGDVQLGVIWTQAFIETFIDGTSVDPGVSNVVEGVAYSIEGVPLVGTFVMPPSVDPGTKNVLSGIAYEIEGESLVGTYTPPPPPIFPGVQLPTDGTLDYNIVRKSIIGAMAYITKLDQNHIMVSEPEQPNVPRPSLPYMTMKITIPGARFGDDDKRIVLDKDGNPTTVVNSGGPRKMTISFNAYATSHENSYNLMSLWQLGLDESNTQALLRQAGIAVWTIGTIADLSELLNTGYEGRSQMDVTFGLAANITSDNGEIDVATVIGQVTADTIVNTISVTTGES